MLGLLFLGLLIDQSWNEVSGQLNQINLLIFGISVLVAVICNIVIAFYFGNLLAKFGVTIDKFLVLKMHLVGQIAKYIPGKVWGIAYQVSHVAGMSGAAGVVLANLELMIGALFMTSIISVVLVSYLFDNSISFVLLTLGLVGFVFIYKSNIVNSILSLVSQKYRVTLGRKKIECRPTRSGDGIIFYLAFCSLYVISNVLMLQAVFGFPVEESILYIAILSAAWIGGFFAFIVPAGMGVREFLFVVISSHVVPQHSVEVLASIAIFSRFWQIIQELVGVSLAIFLRR